MRERADDVPRAQEFVLSEAAVKKPSGRLIVVDDVEYRWKAGTGMIEVRHDGRVFLRVDTAKALGLSNDDHERAIWKRTLNCAVTPGLVAELIRGRRLP